MRLWENKSHRENKSHKSQREEHGETIFFNTPEAMFNYILL